MRNYNIYSDRLEISFDNCTEDNLEYILVSLSQDLLNYYNSLPYGKGITFRSIAYLIEDLANILDFNHVDKVHVIGILRNAFSFLRRLKFPDFQINIINHV